MRISAVVIAGFLVCWSALEVVQTRHESRKLFVSLQGMEKQRDLLIDDWGRLQLEQATWGTHSRIEEVARDKLEMMLPESQNVKLLSKGIKP